MKYLKQILILPALLFICQAGFYLMAQETAPPLITDRPDQTESSCTVPLKSIQIETGILIEEDKGINGEYSGKQYPGFLLRYGLSPNLEIRFGGAFGNIRHHPSESAGASSVTGLFPLQAGAKIFISGERGIWPELAFIGGLNLPETGHPELSTDHLTPVMLIAASHSLNEYLGLGWNLGAEWESFNPKANGIYSVVLGISVSDRLGAFIETYGRYSPGEDADHRANAGITYLLGPNIQLDASAGLGITEAAPDYFISAGASFRIMR